MAIRLILFDLDGTLVDSSTDISLAINHALLPFGIDPFTVEETKGLVGEGISRLVEKVMERAKAKGGIGTGIDGGNGHMQETIFSRFMEHYTAHALDNTPLYPGVRETLATLADYYRAVISNKREFLSKKILEGLGVIGHFEMVIGSDTVAERKPSPVPVLHVLNTLQVSPHEAMMVGDSGYDIMAGKAAGVMTTAVTYGYRPLRDLRDADFIIDELPALTAILAGIR